MNKTVRTFLLSVISNQDKKINKLIDENQRLENEKEYLNNRLMEMLDVALYNRNK